MEFRMLDGCCGAGLAGFGYWRSGCFSEIVGVDIDPDMRHVYPFDFIQGDVLALDYDFLAQFDFIHVSPPCQYYSKVTPKWARDRHMRLIPGTHLMLAAAGVPCVIENVPGSGHDLKPNLTLSGKNFGLPIDRPRLFYVSEKIRSCQSSQINSGQNINISAAANVNPHGSEYVSRHELIEAFGLNEMPVSYLRNLNIDHILQGIPPAFTTWIARRLFDRLWIR